MIQNNLLITKVLKVTSTFPQGVGLPNKARECFAKVTVTCFFTNRSLCSEFDAAGRNIKYPWFGIIDATAGPVCHDEIVFRNRVPRPKGITAFHQVINDQRLFRSDRVGAITAYNLWCGLIEINGDRECGLG